jgi:hypothetical protein
MGCLHEVSLRRSIARHQDDCFEVVKRTIDISVAYSNTYAQCGIALHLPLRHFVNIREQSSQPAFHQRQSGILQMDPSLP